MTRLAVLGASGFIGRHVAAQVKSEGYDVIADNMNERLDLSNESVLQSFLVKSKPNVVINCAGIITGEDMMGLNQTMTLNVLRSAITAGSVGKVVIMGSAAEYGYVDPAELPITETHPLQATSPYGKSKIAETTSALEFGKQNDLDVKIARLFNPIGVGMKPKQLIPQLIRQLNDIQKGKIASIELSRLDSLRDYIDVRDVARAIAVIGTMDGPHDVYNVASGNATTNQELLSTLLGALSLPNSISVHQTQAKREQPVASHADISRMKDDFSWTPIFSLHDAIEEIVQHG